MSAPRIPITRPELPPLEDYVSLLREIWSTRMLSNYASFAPRLEALAGAYIGVGVRAVSSGDTALVLGIAALGVPRGTIAIVPSFTFSSTVNAVLWNGLRPVFADIDAETLTLNPDSVEAAARDSGGASLIVATQCFGVPADDDALRSVADRFGARLAYDAAHAYGSLHRGVHAGALGDLAAFSLSATKVATSGEGGLVASRDPELLERITLLRGYGFYGDYNAKLLGMNGKLSEIHAALGLLSLARIEEALAVRERHLARYRELLDAVSGIRFQRVHQGDRSTYKDLVVLFESAAARASVERALASDGVQTKRYFLPCHQMDLYRGYTSTALPVTESTYERALCLPLYESLVAEDVDRICDRIVRALP